MKFSHSKADVYVPGGARPPGEALAAVTHLCVAAHQDDIEIMAHAGISDCLETPGMAFGGVRHGAWCGQAWCFVSWIT